MRIKKIALNSLMETIFYLIIAVIGLLKVKFIIQGLGSEINGYYQFINQIITYIMLAEAGLSGAVLYKMYKPVAENNKIKVAELFNGSRSIYRKIGILILSISIFVIPILYIYTMKTDITFEIIITFFLLIISQALPFIAASRSYTSLMAADQKRYVFGLITNILRIITDVLIIVMVINFKSIITISLINLISSIIMVSIIFYIGNKMYPWLNLTEKKDTSAKEMSKDMIVHQFGSVIYNNVDGILIMTFLGPILVSTYFAYNYIVSFLRELIGKNSDMITNILGNIFVKENKEKSSELFLENISLFAFASLLISICFIIGARSFIGIWINNDAYILSYTIVFFFAFELFLSIITKPINAAIISNGLYKESKYFSIIESIINILLSIILLNLIGLSGILLATCTANIIGLFLRNNLICNKIFDKKIKKDLLIIQTKTTVIFIGTALSIFALEQNALKYITNYYIWILIMSITFIISFIIFGVFQWSTEKSFKRLTKKILNYNWKGTTKINSSTKI